jgi:hypothetical protein
MLPTHLAIKTVAKNTLATTTSHASDVIGAGIG